MIWGLYFSTLCIVLIWICKDNVWAFMFFGLLNAFFVNFASDRYDKLMHRIEKLERSQAEKKEGAE